MPSVGSIYVDVLPNVSGFPDRLRGGVLPSADEIGRQMGQIFADRIAAGIRDGLGAGFRGGRDEGARGGSESGGAFADAFKAKVSAALRALPKVDITADASEADKKIAELRAQLEALSKQKIGVDIQADAALAKIEAIRAEFERLGAESASLQVKVDTAAAVAQLTALEQRFKDEPPIEVPVVANVGAFDRKIHEAIERARAALPELTITADSSEADRKIAALRAQLKELGDKKVGVDIDGAAAKAELDRIKVALTELGAKSASVQVRVDTARASAELAAFDAEIDRVNDKKVEPDTSSGVQGFNALIAAGVALGPALIPVAAASVAAIVAIGQAAAGAAAAAGVGILALKPVVGGLSALSAADNIDPNVAVQQAKARANGIASANSTVQSATASLANAQASAAAGAVTAANSVANAEAAQASGAINAARAVSDAQRSAAQGVAAANLGVTSSEQSLTSAQLSARAAQQSLTDARKAAQQQLEDYKNQLADGALAERAAALQIVQTRAALALTKGTASTVLQREQAQLAYDQAVQQQTDLTTQQTRLKAAAALAAKVGVDGSRSVIAAQQGVVAANQSVGNSQAALVRAQAAVVEAQRKGDEQVAAAQKTQVDQARTSAASVQAAQLSQDNQARTSEASIVSAQASLANAQRSLATAYAQTGTAGQAAANGIAQAFKNLSPVGAEFTRFLYGLKSPLDLLSKKAQDGLLPGLETFIKSLLPYIPALAGFVGTLAKTLGDLFVAAGKALTGPFWTQFFAFLGREQPKWLVMFAETVGNITTGLAGLFQALAPVGDTLNGAILSGTKSFADWATSLGKNKGFQTFLQYVKDSLPQVGAFLGALVGAGAALIKALAPIGPVILNIVTQALKFIAALSPTQFVLIVVGIALVQIAMAAIPAILGLVTAGTVTLGGVLGAILSPIAAVAAVLVGLGVLLYELYQHNVTFRKIVDETFTAVRGFVVTAWEGYIKPALSALWGYLQTQIFPTVLKLWHEVVLPAFTQIGGIIKNTWESIILPALKALWSFITVVLAPVILFLLKNVVGPTFKLIGEVIVFVWQKVISPALSGLNAGISGLGAVFQGALDGIKSIWGGLGAIIKDPISAVLQFIQSAFIDPINAMLGALQLSITIPKVFQSALAGASPNNASSVVSSPHGKGLADGGVVPGYSPHARADNIPAWLTAGEFVLPVGATAAIASRHGAAGLESLRQGRMPGYADGGLIGSIGSAIGSAASSVNAFSGSLRSAILDGAGFAAKVVSDPGSAIHDLISAVVGQLSSSPFAQVAGAAVSKVGDGLIGKITGAFASQSQQSPSGPLVQGVPGSASASAAVQYALGQIAAGTGGWLDRCLAFVNAAWGHRVPWLGAPRAIDAWNSAPGKHFDTSPPAGAALFYDHLGPAGHVDLSLGGNAIASTDLPNAGRVGLDNFSDPMTKWGAHYLGWALPGYADGGTVGADYGKPLLFDSGGRLPMGTSVVQNNTGAPEDLVRADRIRTGAQIHQSFHIPNVDAHEVAAISAGMLAFRLMSV